MFLFGAGKLSVTPTVGDDAYFGTVQEVSVDFSFSEKELYGEYQFPVDIARTQGKINIKAKAATIDAKLFNDVFFQGAAIEAGGRTTITVTNKLMGSSPVFALTFEVTYQGKRMTIVFPRCISSKLALAFKNEDHTIPDFDINAFAADDGRLYTVTVEE